MTLNYDIIAEGHYKIGEVYSADSTTATYNYVSISAGNPYSLVDNTQGAYYLWLDMPATPLGGGAIHFDAAYIDYEYT